MSEMMKNTVSLWLMLCCFGGIAQEWAPVGAKWHYSMNESTWPLGVGTSYSVFESTGDTTIAGITCRKILKNKSYLSFGCRPDLEFTYYSNDSVYFFDPNFPGFQLLYDFSASPGEYWYYPYPDYCGSPDVDTIKVTVDSTDVVVINSYSLRRLFVHYDTLGFEATAGGSAWPELIHTSVIIEFIGDINNMFYSTTMDELIFDFSLPFGLRCYEDTIIGHYETGIVDSCDWVNLLSVPQIEKEKIALYPNPSVDDVKISGLEEDVQIQIYDLRGNLVMRGNATEDQSVFCVSKLNCGTYFVKVIGNSTNQSAVLVKL